jgi:hypothetical protein
MKTYSYLFLAFYLSKIPGAIAQQKSQAIPDFVVTQYAGSIGYASVGLGYDITHKTRASLHYGFVPETKGGNLHILSTKFMYSPQVIELNENIQLNPFDFGIMTTYHFGKKFHDRWPSRYPEGYYWWTSSIRFHLITESSFTYSIPKSKSFFKSVTGYIEFNINDLYIVSLAQNPNSVSLFDMVNAGIGVRLRF